MDIGKVADIIGKIADGIEDVCLKSLQANKDDMLRIVSEQLMSGLDGDEEYLYPTYDNDPYFTTIDWWFTEHGVTYHGPLGYKKWKEDITPPESGPLLSLAPRPEEVPNLWIDGTFHSSIKATDTSEGVLIYASGGDAPAIVAKYGEQILALGDTARRYMIEEHILPAIDKFFKDCGYR